MNKNCGCDQTNKVPKTTMDKKQIIDRMLLLLKNYSGEEDEHGVLRTQLGYFIDEVEENTIKEIYKSFDLSIPENATLMKLKNNK